MSAAESKALYDSFVAELYDASPVVSGRADLEFYQDYAARARGRILELGCGTGRILLALARAGHAICGLDLSRTMLEKCRRKVEAELKEVQGRVRLVEGDMCRFQLDGKFKLIIIPFRPFQHLQTIEEQMACLRSVHQRLEPGGRLILDLFHTDARRMHDSEFLAEREIPGETLLPDGRSFRVAERTVAFHRAIQANDVELIYYVRHPDGRTERLVFSFRIRYFFRYEVENMLARCGFRTAELFGNFDRSPLSDNSPEMLFVAEKAEG